MDCPETRRTLHQFVDLELGEDEREAVRGHLEGCPACRSLHQDIVRLKRLVHAKVRRPLAPAALGNLIRRRLIARRRVPGRGALAAAGVVLALGLAGSFVLVFRGPEMPRLAHAEMVRLCLGDFRGLIQSEPPRDGAAGGARAPSRGDGDRVLELLRKELALDLEALPAIPGGRLEGGETCSFGGVSGVRLDYVVQSGESGADHPLSVFVFPLSGLDCKGELLEMMRSGKLCRCVPGAGNTVFCFRSGAHVYNAVTTLEEDVLLAEHRPAMPRRGGE